MVAVIGAGIGASIGIASLLPTSAPAVPPEKVAEAMTDLAFSDASDFPAKTFNLHEGYAISLVQGWELVAYTPDRQVDRYRFERKDNRQHIFTISVYDRKQTPTFADLITARYGASMLREDKDVTIAGLPAKRVTAEFLDMGATTDVLVQAGPDRFLSLYGVRQPSTDANLQIAKEINFMQKSLRITNASTSAQ